MDVVGVAFISIIIHYKQEGELRVQQQTQEAMDIIYILRSFLTLDITSSY